MLLIHFCYQMTCFVDLNLEESQKLEKKPPKNLLRGVLGCYFWIGGFPISLHMHVYTYTYAKVKRREAMHVTSASSQDPRTRSTITGKQLVANLDLKPAFFSGLDPDLHFRTSWISVSIDA